MSGLLWLCGYAIMANRRLPLCNVRCRSLRSVTPAVSRGKAGLLLLIEGEFLGEGTRDALAPAEALEVVLHRRPLRPEL